MTITLLHDLAIVPALSLLPPNMDSPGARAMMVATALQESKLISRVQFSNGPAHGWWQFEIVGVAGVMTHPAVKEHAERLCRVLGYPPAVHAVYTAVEHNDILAAGFARLLLWTIPMPLPSREIHQDGWLQYVQAWRPGKPRQADWEGNYQTAWTLVDGMGAVGDRPLNA